MKIRNTFLMALVLVFLAVPAFADPPSGGGDATATATALVGSGNTQNGAGASMSILSPTATGGAGGAGGNATIQSGAIKNTVDTNIGNGIGNFSPSAKATIEKGAVSIDNKNTNTNTNIGVNSQKQGQKQQQGQSQSSVNIVAPKQGQNQNNNQVIAPEQTVVFKSPTQLMSPPSQVVPELNFGNGRMKDATKELPRFAMYGIKALTDEAITEVLNVDANVKFKNLYKAILSDAKDVAGAKDFKSAEVRYQVIRAEAQKTWTTGGNFGGAGSGLATSGLGGGSGAGSIVPQWGGTKSDDLFTILFLRVYVGK